MRELHVRFGRDNIGYLWLIGEPMMLATVISTVHYVASVDEGFTSLAPFPFTLVGYCLFIIFRGIFNRAEGAIEGNSSLFHHKMIKPIDIMIAKAVIECLGCVSSLIVLLTIGILLGIADPPARPLYLMFGALLVTWWSFALSLIVAGVTYGSHALGRFVHPISYFMVPLSGAFWTMSFLPLKFRAFMAWNPMATMFEIARYGQFRWASADYMFPEYAIAVCAGLTFVGLVLIRKLKYKLQVS
ncbi:ABC transporter permease [Novosphingobium sp. 2580]|uniref:ABC transporter permease n=2 Tax=Novosphingobium album (ex Hu et al. 2023) TaxID=2930093 RepID=A0ABT0B6E6_9SPHN|nr:ABC transporter permease [Novosphingobium album (ex Hu et al. 2023)]